MNDKQDYLVLRLYIRPPIQEEGDGGMATLCSSPMEGGISPLPVQQRQTDRHTYIRNLAFPLQVRVRVRASSMLTNLPYPPPVCLPAYPGGG